MPYLAMEFLAGEDLEHLMERLGPLSAELAVRVVAWWFEDVGAPGGRTRVAKSDVQLTLSISFAASKFR